MLRSTVASALALGLGLILLLAAAPGPAAAGHHEPVIQVITVHVKPGKLEKYRQEVAKLTGVMARLGSPATTQVWRATAGGDDTGNVLVGIEYPNMAAWAANSTKAQADSEWQKIVAGLDDVRTIESNAVWRNVSPTPAAADGSSGVLLITGVAVKPGKLDTYLERLASGRAIVERLGLKGRMRTWRAELAGAETGAVVVGIEYADLPTYVAEQARLTADPEWRKLIAGLESIRTLGGRWLYEDITP